MLPGPALQGTERRCRLGGGLSPGVWALEGLAPVQPPSLLPRPPSAQPLLLGTGHLPQAPLETGLTHQPPPAHWLLQTVHPGARLPPPAPNTRPRRPQPPGVVVQHEEPCVGGGVWRQVGTTPATGHWGHTRRLRPSVLPLTLGPEATVCPDTCSRHARPDALPPVRVVLPGRSRAPQGLPASHPHLSASRLPDSLLGSPPSPQRILGPSAFPQIPSLCPGASHPVGA